MGETGSERARKSERKRASARARERERERETPVNILAQYYRCRGDKVNIPANLMAHAVVNAALSLAKGEMR